MSQQCQQSLLVNSHCYKQPTTPVGKRPYAPTAAPCYPSPHLQRGTPGPDCRPDSDSRRVTAAPAAPSPAARVAHSATATRIPSHTLAPAARASTHCLQQHPPSGPAPSQPRVPPPPLLHTWHGMTTQVASLNLFYTAEHEWQHTARVSALLPLMLLQVACLAAGCCDPATRSFTPAGKVCRHVASFATLF
jgi:hypothetical protein